MRPFRSEVLKLLRPGMYGGAGIAVGLSALSTFFVFQVATRPGARPEGRRRAFLTLAALHQPHALATLVSQSSQFLGVPRHDPLPLQASESVQPSPSLHEVPAAT